MSQPTSTSARPLIREPGDGEALWFGTNRITIKATASDTGGRYGLFEVWALAGSGPPLHVHRDAEEAFWILEGELTVRCGTQLQAAGPGSFVLLPRGVPHTFRVKDGRDARWLTLLSPGGSERFFAEAGTPATGPGLPPGGAFDLTRLREVSAAHDMEIVGPPLSADEA